MCICFKQHSAKSNLLQEIHLLNCNICISAISQMHFASIFICAMLILQLVASSSSQSLLVETTDNLNVKTHSCICELWVHFNLTMLTIKVTDVLCWTLTKRDVHLLQTAFCKVKLVARDTLTQLQHQLHICNISNALCFLSFICAMLILQLVASSSSQSLLWTTDNLNKLRHIVKHT